MKTTLPYDTSTEDGVLGSVIQNPGEYDKVSKYFVDIEILYQNRARLLWKRITEMKANGERIDTLTICSTVNEKDNNKGLTKHYIVGCTSQACAKGFTDYHAIKLYEKYLLRRVIISAQEVFDKAQGNDGDVYDKINEAHLLFGELLNSRPTKIQDINDIINETLESIKNKTTKLVKTGYSNIDRFAGGLTRGEVTIIGGRPGHGKTTVLINLLAKALENGKRAIFFSRELPNAELFKKILCLESGQLSYSVMRKNVFTDTDIKIINTTLKGIKKKYSSENFLMFDNIRNFSLSSSEVKKFKPDIIFDDYIQLIECKGYEDSRRLQIEKLVNDYKWLAKETNAVVVLASQLNRGIERDSRGKSYNPQLSDLAESGAIEQVAENVFFSYYDYKVKGEAGKGKNVISLHACKVRYGDSGISDLGYDGDKCKIYNTEKEVLNDILPY